MTEAKANPVAANPATTAKAEVVTTSSIETKPEAAVKVVAAQPPVQVAPADGKEHAAKMTKAHDHLKDLENNALTFAGKDGMNPFAYINNVIRPCRVKLVKGANDKELDEILALQKEEPTVAKHWKNPLDTAI